MISFLPLCSSGAPKDDIYKLQQDKYYLANEKKKPTTFTMGASREAVELPFLRFSKADCTRPQTM